MLWEMKLNVYNCWELGTLVAVCRGKKIFPSRFFTEKDHERISHHNKMEKKVGWLPRKNGEKQDEQFKLE